MIASLLALVGILGIAEGFVGMSPARLSLGNSFVPPTDAVVAAAAGAAVNAGGKLGTGTCRLVSIMTATTQAGTGTGTPVKKKYDLQSWAKVSR